MEVIETKLNANVDTYKVKTITGKIFLHSIPSTTPSYIVKKELQEIANKLDAIERGD